jgi:hypothetical protein
VVCALTFSANTTHAMLPAALRRWVVFMKLLLVFSFEGTPALDTPDADTSFCRFDTSRPVATRS